MGNDKTNLKISFKNLQILDVGNMFRWDAYNKHDKSDGMCYLGWSYSYHKLASDKILN